MIVKIGRTTFNQDAIKAMGLKDFKVTYKEILKDQDLDKIFKQVVEAKEPKKEAVKGA